MAGFALDATDVSSDSGVSTNANAALAATGVTNAFTNSTNLVDSYSGLALTTTPVGIGSVPYPVLYSLANILAACNEDSSVCSTLFDTATSNGIPIGSTGAGTAPTDTATAAIYIAQNPAANVSTLYGLIPSSPPYAMGLTSTPNDFTVALSWFPGGGGSSGGPAGTRGIAIDGQGNVWITDYWSGSSNAFVAELSSTGVLLALGPGTGGPGYAEGPQGLAIDGSGNAWVTALAGIPLSFYGEVVEFSSSGSAISTVTTLTDGGVYSPFMDAFDASGNLWVTNGGSNDVSEFNTSLSPVFTSGDSNSALAGNEGIAADSSGYIWVATPQNAVKLDGSGSVVYNVSVASSASTLYSAATDNSGNVWISDASASSIIKVSSSGSVLSPSGGYTGGGLNSPTSLSVDGAGHVWVANPANSSGISSVTELSNSGVILSGSNGLLPFYAGGFQQIAIDGSGDAWIASYGGLVEIIGAATPVVTPLATAVATNTLGHRP
jgi:streptogramin lyase